MALFGKVADDPERFIELCRSNSPPPRFSSDPCPLARLLLPPAKFSELPELLCDSSSNWFQRNVYKPNQVQEKNTNELPWIHHRLRISLQDQVLHWNICRCIYRNYGGKDGHLHFFHLVHHSLAILIYFLLNDIKTNYLKRCRWIRWQKFSCRFFFIQEKFLPTDEASFLIPPFFSLPRLIRLPPGQTW